MTISLTAELERIIRAKVERGEYDSAQALIEEAVQRLIEEENQEDADQQEIRARVEAAEAEIDRGDYVVYDENTVHRLASEVHERGMKKLAAERKKPGKRG